MNFNSLNEIASYKVSDGKGILAADESIQLVQSALIRLVLSLQKKIEEIIENCFLELRV